MEINKYVLLQAKVIWHSWPSKLDIVMESCFHEIPKINHKSIVVGENEEINIELEKTNFKSTFRRAHTYRVIEQPGNGVLNTWFTDIPVRYDLYSLFLTYIHIPYIYPFISISVLE